ncbi:MAG TPA: cytochrome P450/oxidoreductase, partial [Hyphomicrobiaceae bacterium]|nr:cytochrome P450/oxidoreductase [Hyphomicrobiaceae bacterium]
EGPFQIDPAESLRWSRDFEPVFYSPKLGYWVVTRYQDVKAVFRDNILFSPSIALEKITPAPPEAERILKGYGYAMNRTMVNEDEPAHMERRRILLESFAPEELAKHEPIVRRLTREYVDRFIDDGRADLVDQMFWEIPLTIALHFLGVEGQDIERLRHYSVAHTLNTWGRPSREEQLKVANAVGQFWQTANQILDTMMADPSGDGWMHFTIRQHLKYPHIVTESYLRSMMMAILAAAHETTANAAANAMRTLLSDRETWDEICENPALIPNAVEECLRRAGSIIAWRRVATRDTKIGGIDIPKGAKLLIVMASANHDEQQFENPTKLDLYRENSTDHLSFGYGSHQCMGKNIARMELRIFLEEFTIRLPHMRLSADQQFSYLPNIAFRGPEHLHVEWNPEQNPERRDRSILESHQNFKIGAPSRSGISRPVRVAACGSEAEGSLRITLEDPHGRELPPWSPGSHISILVGGYERYYSLCGSQHDSKRYEIVVLRDPNGRGGSNYIHQHITPRMTVSIKGPKNHFHLDEHADHYVLIAGGIGITPIIAMADRLKQIGKDYVIHYAGRSLARMPLVGRLNRDHSPRLQLYSAADGRRMDLAVLLQDLQMDTKVYACGPERMLSELSTMAENWPNGMLHTEHFAASGPLLDPEKESGFQVELKDSNLTIEVAPNQTLLRALQSAGVDVACDCEEGLCGSCEVLVLDGEIDHRDKVLTKNERAENRRMMACCSRARGHRLTLSL